MKVLAKPHSKISCSFLKFISEVTTLDNEEL